MFKEHKSHEEKHELKTIFVDTTATHLKLVVGTSHLNTKLNPNNLCGLVKMEIFGSFLKNDSGSRSGLMTRESNSHKHR